MKPSSDQCLSACKGEKACSHFSFNPENGLCLLYQECINFDYDDPDYVSGNVICDYQNITCNMQKSTNILHLTLTNYYSFQYF